MGRIRQESFGQDIIVLAVSILLFAGFAILVPGFVSAGNFVGLVRNVSVLGVLAIGMAIRRRCIEETSRQLGPETGGSGGSALDAVCRRRPQSADPPQSRDASISFAVSSAGRVNMAS
jgi:hypothetical protein